MTATFYVGDAVTVMNTLPEKSVDLILTSPPFLALRSYLPQDHPDKALEGGSQATPGAYIDWLLDVVEACARVLAPHGSLCFELGDTYSGTGGAGGDWSDSPMTTKARVAGGSIGGPTKRDISDAWPLTKSLSLIPESFRWAMVYGHNPHTGRTTPPWRLRNVIRWVRPNPPVGALGDKFRPATSELMVFCKAKDRFFDLDAVRSPSQQPTPAGDQEGRYPGGNPTYGPGRYGANSGGTPPLDWWNIPSDAQVRSLNYVECGCTESCMMDEVPDQFRPATSELLVFCKSKTRFFDLDAVREPLKDSPGNRYVRAATTRDAAFRSDAFGSSIRGAIDPTQSAGAPPLDWWNIPPGGYPGAHYAVWPPELLVKPIKAMCPEKVCRVCGEASRRIVDVTYVPTPDGHPERPPPQLSPGQTESSIEMQHQMGRGVAASGTTVLGVDSSFKYGRATKNVETLGFSDCLHDDYRPGLVLDPFAGSGTTLAVATGHGRDAIGIDLDEKNYELALDRVGPLILQRGEIRDGTGPPD